MIALAHAHGDAPSAHWTAWSMTPDILAATLLVAVLYAAGLRRRRGKGHAAARWRHWAFFGGLAAVFVALQSPLDGLAGRSFFMHQVQHLLLQTLGPMLLLLASPQTVLAAGFPATLRRATLAPLMGSPTVRGIFRFFTRPWTATLVLVASLYVWHWPPYHDLAVLDDSVHYLMHFSMLSAGLLFFAAVFDPRPAPLGTTYAVRVTMLWAAMTANVVLGAVLALKTNALYFAYDAAERPWKLGALEDEQLGGLLMWIPGSALCVPAFFVLLRMWNFQEARVELRRRGGFPSTAGAVTGNNRIALWLALAAFAGFAGTLGIGVMVTGPGR